MSRIRDEIRTWRLFTVRLDLFPVVIVLNLEIFHEVSGLVIDLKMMPRSPPLLFPGASKDDETAEFMASDQAPASEEFNQVVGVTLRLG